ncbi:hypothetical protein OAS39_03915 [Pirellulales bacterium]|nr:hypothetical protein [Pirellulales bacterium]
MSAATSAATTSSFDALSEDQLESHLGVKRYGSFTLTDAVRPSYDLEVVPSAGFRHDIYRDQENDRDIPVVMAAASREQLFETFMEVIEPLGATVDVVLESSHHDATPKNVNMYREHIDMPILQSILWDFETLLVNDGCTGIAVLNPQIPQEVQFDEHKLLIVYGEDINNYESVLRDSGLACREDMKFITEAEHVHSTNDDFLEQLHDLRMQLGMDGSASM